MPGNPRVMVTNLPGGGGLLALQETMRSNPDGLTITSMTPRFLEDEAAGEDVEGFDIETANFIGTPRFDDDHLAMYVRRDVATNWDEVLALGRSITAGATIPGGNMIGGQFVEALGGPIRVIHGYWVPHAILVAVARGELDATTLCNVRYSNLHSHYRCDSHDLVPLFWSRSPISQEFLDRLGTGLQSDDVPHLFDVFESTEEQQAAFLLAQNLQSMKGMFVMAPDTPEDIVLAWQRVFREIVEDPEFIEEAAEQGRRVKYGDPVLLVENIQKAKDFSPEARELFASISGVQFRR